MRKRILVVGVAMLALLGLAAPPAAAQASSLPDDIEAALDQLREVVPLIQESLAAVAPNALKAAGQVQAAGAGSTTDFASLVASFGPLVSEVRPLLEDVGRSLQTIAEAIVAGRVDAAGLLDTVLSLLGPLFGFVSDLLPALLPFLGPVLGFLADNLGAILPAAVNILCTVANTLIPSFKSLIDSVCGFLRGSMGIVVSVLSAVLGFLTTGLSPIIDFLQDLLGGGSSSNSAPPRKPLPETGAPLPFGPLGLGVLGLASALAVVQRRPGRVRPPQRG